MRMPIRWKRLPAFALAVLLIGASGSDVPPLVEAARTADTERLRALLEEGEDVNAAALDGTTALHWASYWDDLAGADTLIRAGANVNAANDLGATPLWAAGLNGSASMTRLLLEAGADPNISLLAGETPLMVAARSGNAEVVDAMLEHGADVGVKATRSQTALMWAAAQGHADVVDVLLAHEADVHARSDVWLERRGVQPHGQPHNQIEVMQGGETALIFAARAGNVRSVERLVAAGADVNDQTAMGVSVTAMAAHSDNAGVVRFLLENGADPNATELGFTALHAAIMRGNQEAVGALLDHGADPDAPLMIWTPIRRDSRDFHFHPSLLGARPYWLAAWFGQPEAMRALFDSGADPNAPHLSDFVTGGSAVQTEVTRLTNALMAALGSGGAGRRFGYVDTHPADRDALTLEMVRVAIEHGVEVNYTDLEGRTAVDIASAQGRDDVVELLTGVGARESERDRDAPRLSELAPPDEIEVVPADRR